MPGYGETMLQGLQHMGSLVNQRRLQEHEAFYQQLNQRNQERQFQVMQNQERFRRQQMQLQLLNQQRANQSMQNLEANRNTQDQLAFKRLEMRLQQMMTPHFGQTQEVVGPDNKARQVVRGTSTGGGTKWYDAQTMEPLPEGVQGSLRVPKPLPMAERAGLEKGGKALQDTVNLLKSFKPEFAGKVVPALGELESTARQYIPGLSSDMPNWWREYQRLSKIPERHGVAGSALTAREIAAFEQGDINPGMKPDDIIAILNRRAALQQRGLGRAMSSAANRYHPREIEQAVGMPMPEDPLKTPQFPDMQALTAMGSKITGVGRPPLDALLQPPAQPEEQQ